MRRYISVFLSVILLASLSACRGQEVGAAALLADFLCERETPAGATYTTGGESGGALSPELVAALYARADGFCEYGECVEEGAVYLSSRLDERFEAGVFLCYGSADTKAVSEMCLRRAALWRRFGEVEAVVECRGRAVYYMLSR